MTKFLKQSDETIRDAITVAERDSRIKIRSADDSSLRECLREIKNLKEQNSRLEQEGINARNAHRYVKATLKDLTNYQVEVSWATQLYGRGELAKRISVQRRNQTARAIRNAYNEMVEEGEDSGGSTPEQHSTTKRREPGVRHVVFNAPPDCIALMIAGAVWARPAQSSGRTWSFSDTNF